MPQGTPLWTLTFTRGNHMSTRGGTSWPFWELHCELTFTRGNHMSTRGGTSWPFWELHCELTFTRGKHMSTRGGTSWAFWLPARMGAKSVRTADTKVNLSPLNLSVLYNELLKYHHHVVKLFYWLNPFHSAVSKDPYHQVICKKTCNLGSSSGPQQRWKLLARVNQHPCW